MGLAKKAPADDYDGGKFALIWYNPKDDVFYVATKASDVASQYAVFTTDGVAERVYTDANGDSAYNHTETAVTAYFTQFTNTLYMSFDASCETGLSMVEPCLQKGDLIFITDANWGQKELVVTKAESTRFFGGAIRFRTATASRTRRTFTPSPRSGRRRRRASPRPSQTSSASLSTRTSTGTARRSQTRMATAPSRRATCRSSSSPRRRRARTLTSRSARTAAFATAMTRFASASRATPTTTATRRARSRCKGCTVSCTPTTTGARLHPRSRFLDLASTAL